MVLIACVVYPVSSKLNVALNFVLKNMNNVMQKQELNKSSIATHCWEKNPTFHFNLAKMITKPISIHEFNFL